MKLKFHKLSSLESFLRESLSKMEKDKSLNKHLDVYATYNFLEIESGTLRLSLNYFSVPNSEFKSCIALKRKLINLISSFYNLPKKEIKAYLKNYYKSITH